METAIPTAKHQQHTRRERGVFSASDDSAMTKQIQATHTPDGREVDVRPILEVVEVILHRVYPGIDGILRGTDDQQIDAVVEKAASADFDGVLEGLTYIVHRVGCEFACKCSGGDAHASTMAILSMLSSFQWDAKVVISLAAFSANYGEFWLVAELLPSNSLAKAVAVLKQLPNMIEHADVLRSRLDSSNNLIRAVMDVTKCILEFKGLPPHYISDDVQPMSIAMKSIPTAVYWCIRSMVVCATLIISLLGLSHEIVSSATETWELSSLAHKLGNIHDHLKTQLAHCHKHIGDKKVVEYFEMIVHLFATPQFDNLKILKTLIYMHDDVMPLEIGTTKQRVNIESLRKKTVLLLISDLDLIHEEVVMLSHIYQESRMRPDHQYEIVWLPVVDRVMPWSEGHENRFMELQSMMPWPTLHHPSMLEPAVIRYIREVWRFAKKPMMVTLDPQGKVVCPNAIHMVWIWANMAYPFTSVREEQLWNGEAWRLELVADAVDPLIFQWMTEDKIVCLYGGGDIEWIRRFTSIAKEVATAADITLEMAYVGKSNNRERVRKINEVILQENLSHCLTDLTFVWYFWARIESMLYSRSQHDKASEKDKLKQQVLTMLSFDGSDEGWALVCRGQAVNEMARAKSEIMLKSFVEYDLWAEEAKERGFVPTLIDYLLKLHTPHHCNRLILPGIEGGIPEMIVCAECSRPMERFFMYRCCTD